MDDPRAPDGACWLIDPPPASLRAFPAHSTCHHNIRKGLRPQAHVDGRNGGDALTPCVANASKRTPTPKFAALFGAQLKGKETAPVAGVMGGQKAPLFAYKSTRTPKFFAPAAGCGRLRREVFLASAAPRRPSWRPAAGVRRAIGRHAAHGHAATWRRAAGSGGQHGRRRRCDGVCVRAQDTSCRWHDVSAEASGTLRGRGTPGGCHCHGLVCSRPPFGPPLLQRA